MPKSKKSKKGINEAKPVNILADKQLLVVIVVVFIICALIGIKTVNSYVLSSSVNPTPAPTAFPIPTLTPTDTPTQTPIPKPIYIAPTTDPDPIIDCNVTNIGTIKTKESQCSISFACEIGQGKWYLYTSKDKCTQDQNSYHGTPSNNYVPPVYVPPVYNPPTNNYQVPTSTYVAPTTDPQAAIDQHNSQVLYCQSNVNSQYSDLIHGCSIRFGDSSATEACTYSYERQRQSAYNACGTTN